MRMRYIGNIVEFFSYFVKVLRNGIEEVLRLKTGSIFINSTGVTINIFNV